MKSPVFHVDREALLTTKPRITCQQFIDFIARYRENELTPSQRAEFEHHLAMCPSCVAYLKTYDQTVMLAKASASEDPPPDDVPESLLKAILDARRRGNA